VPVFGGGGARSTNAVKIPSGALVVSKRSSLSRLKRYLIDNIPDGLIDLRDPSTELPENHDHDNALGYIGLHDKKIRIWLSNTQFEKVAGGRREAQKLKRVLVNLGLLEVWGRGQGKTGPSVRRHIANLGWQYVVEIKPSTDMLARLRKLKSA
jgi:hypothetical protein